MLHHGTTIHLGASSLAELDASYKESLLHTQPSVNAPLMIEMTIPSAIDNTLAPAGKHVATLFVQCMLCLK
jgi:phytoene dehydrogenase-like protein